MVSIIIPAKNEEKHLSLLLSDLQDQSLQPYEVIVADADSNDRTRQVAESMGAKVVRGGLPSYGRNKGAEAASSDFLIFLDADTRVDTQFVEHVRSGLSSYDAVTVKNQPICRALSGFQVLIIRFCYVVLNAWMWVKQFTASPVAVGTCLAARRRVWDDIRFDEDVYWGEDSVFVTDLTRMGYTFKVLHHEVGVSTRRMSIQGLYTFLKNTLKLQLRSRKGPIRDKEDYAEVTGISDHFEKS